MSTPDNSPATAAKTAVPDGCGACHCEPGTAAPQDASTAGWSRFRVPTMDCASEESEIRRAVEGINGLRAMSFQLAQRTMAMDAPVAAVELALAAIRKAGFDPQPLHDAGTPAARTAGHSGHPVSRAVAAGLRPNSVDAKNFKTIDGRTDRPRRQTPSPSPYLPWPTPTAADVVVMSDDRRRIAQTVQLSRFTHTVLWQNIALALGIKAVFLVLAVFGSATMWMAGFAAMGAKLLVVANGLRLLRRGLAGP